MSTQKASKSVISIDQLIELTGADRSARAYAFLYASFRQSEVSSAPVRDALDCLTPFMLLYFSDKNGKQVNLQDIQTFLNQNFSFEIPLYALEQILPDLQRRGYVKYNKTTQAYLVHANDINFNLAKNEIGSDFDAVVSRLTDYAAQLGLKYAPFSNSWGEALISFLKDASSSADHNLRNIKGAIVDPGKIEAATIGSFLRDLSESDSETFNGIINIYMGVIIEDFISSITEIGELDPNNPVTIFYDTAVILRLLGSSGRLLRIATEELTRYLQDLGFSIRYFSGNETEVSNIIDTIIFVKDKGGELEGETAEALSTGEITVSEIRWLKSNLAETLAKWNIFPADDLELNVQKNAYYQIDENAFSEYLLQQSLANKRPYSSQNRRNDAGYLGNVVRLRKNHKTRDLAFCRYLFVTSNKFLAKSSRQFLIKERVITPYHCAPILHLGQVATIAWLLKEQSIPPEKAGRELLLNCFAAVRPDAAWFGHFREGIEKIVGPMEEFSKDGKNNLTIQAARRIAQDESFANSAIVRELNMAEILQRARVDSERELADIENAAKTELERAEKEGQERINNIKHRHDNDILRERELERNRTLATFQDSARRRAKRMADGVIAIMKWVLVIPFAIATAVIWWKQGESSIPIWLWVVTLAVSLFSVLGFMDLIGIPYVKYLLDRIRSYIEVALYKILFIEPT